MHICGSHSAPFGTIHIIAVQSVCGTIRIPANSQVIAADSLHLTLVKAPYPCVNLIERSMHSGTHKPVFFLKAVQWVGAGAGAGAAAGAGAGAVPEAGAGAVWYLFGFRGFVCAASRDVVTWTQCPGSDFPSSKEAHTMSRQRPHSWNFRHPQVSGVNGMMDKENSISSQTTRRLRSISNHRFTTSEVRGLVHALFLHL